MAAKILVSACLLGQPVRYNGTASTLESEILETWRRAGRIVPLCPEVAAGFAVPRPPAEIEPGCDGEDVRLGTARILEDTGGDVTRQFRDGAERTLAHALSHDCRYALLTDGSPSCGSSFIYSGAHDGVRRAGQGVVTATLRASGIQVFGQHQIAALDRLIA
ncbi:MAG: DUF523 domain-containing protein [Pseudomonadota bacterium]